MKSKQHKRSDLKSILSVPYHIKLYLSTNIISVHKYNICPLSSALRLTWAFETVSVRLGKDKGHEYFRIRINKQNPRSMSHGNIRGGPYITTIIITSRLRGGALTPFGQLSNTQKNSNRNFIFLPHCGGCFLDIFQGTIDLLGPGQHWYVSWHIAHLWLDRNLFFWSPVGAI